MRFARIRSIGRSEPNKMRFGPTAFISCSKTYSLLFALIVASVGAALARQLHASFKTAFGFLFISVASHGLLDALTNGGLGIALFWPVSSVRFFLPWHPIEVSPLAISRFFSLKGLAVLWSEFLWVWLPCFTLAIIASSFRRWRRSGS